MTGFKNRFTTLVSWALSFRPWPQRARDHDPDPGGSPMRNCTYPTEMLVSRRRR